MSETVYGQVHQRVLRLAASHKERPFRPAALVALAGLPVEHGRSLTDALEAFGLIERLTVRKKVYLGFGIEFAQGAEGQDAGVGYYRWVEELTSDYTLTVNGQDEAGRLAKLGPAADRATEERQALLTRLADVQQANEELRASLAEKAESSLPNCPQCRQDCRRGSRHCHRCGTEVISDD